MSGHHSQFTRQIARQNAKAALGRMRFDARKADTPFNGRRWWNQHVADIAAVADADAAAGAAIMQAVPDPAVGERDPGPLEYVLNAAERQLADEPDAEKSEGHGIYRGPGQLAPTARISPAAMQPEAERFRSEVQDVLASSPDSTTAERRVRQTVAVEATRLALRGKR